MITFLDLIQIDEFRGFVSRQIEARSHQRYLLPSVLPPLYRYRSFSTYAVDDILNSKITLTSIGEFNDIFDGAIHQYGTKEEIEKAAEAKWLELETIRKAARLPDGVLPRDAVVKPYIEHLKNESRLKFRELDYLGTYVCCFSQENSSTLMWAHYADSNKGICIEYDFNKLPITNLLRKSVFPVVYTQKPIDTTDLMSDAGKQVYQYSFDAGILCSAINKASIWQYEQEWRIVWVLGNAAQKDQRFTINSPIMPSRICFGYQFLRSFFYYNSRNDSEYGNSKNNIKRFKEIIAFMQKNEIKAAVMAPSIGSYQFVPHDITTDELFEFVLQHFRDERPESMRYYYVVHDQLMDLIEKPQEDNHV